MLTGSSIRVFFLKQIAYVEFVLDVGRLVLLAIVVIYVLLQFVDCTETKYSPTFAY